MFVKKWVGMSGINGSIQRNDAYTKEYFSVSFHGMHDRHRGNKGNIVQYRMFRDRQGH